MFKIFIFISVLFFIGCGSGTSESGIENLNSNVNINTTTDTDSKDIKIKPYFSKNRGSFNGGIDDFIVEKIENAHSSIYLAMYDFTNKKIKNALIEAHDRGVKVEIITDDTKIEDEIYLDLNSSNITIYNDNYKYGLMHNKFLIIDKNILFSGSANFTYYSFYRNYENVVLIENQDIAKAYLDEFYEIVNKNLVQKSYKFYNIELYFSPEDNFKKRLINLIQNANKSIYFLVYSFTDSDIAKALIDAKKRGVLVKGVLDKTWNKNSKYSQYDQLLNASIDIKYDGSYFKLHDKVMIIDKNITVTGSYNFTNSANYNNNENSLIIYNSNIARHYLDEFNKIYLDATNTDN